MAKRIAVVVGIIATAAIGGSNLLGAFAGWPEFAADPQARPSEDQKIIAWLMATPWWISGTVSCVLAGWLVYITGPQMAAVAPGGKTGAGDRQITRTREPAIALQEPAYVVDLFELHRRVVTAAIMSSTNLSKGEVATRIYDPLQSGRLHAWGRESLQYPVLDIDPWPPRKPIESSFWKRNAIEDLEHWLSHSRYAHAKGDATITMPEDGSDRSRAMHYWDLVFLGKDVDRLWAREHG